jgi:hypothetical protein
MLLIAAMQWILGPWIEYITPETHYLFHMYVSESSYMSFVVPCVLAMHAGISVFSNNIKLHQISKNAANSISNYPSFPYLLIVTGLTIPLISPFLPPQLGFVYYLLANLKYIGAIYLMFSISNYRWLIFSGIMLLTLIISISTSMFHDFILWAVLSFTFLAYEFKLKMVTKIGILILAGFFLITVQAIKPKVRELAWSGAKVDSELALFITLSIEEWKSGSIFNPKSQNDLNVRLNQGWIISKIMDHVPKYEPYANGSTISEAILTTLVPRFINPNKAIAGGKKNFEKYTGHKLQKTTSMGISLAGEGWANYGYMGGIIFMFSWGFFISWFWKFLNVKTNIYPTILIWSPLIFQQVIKAETELLDVLNHLVKSAILVFLIIWFLKKQFRIQV